MPECLLLAYHANLDRLRAERQLDAAQAATVPHLSKDGHKSWYRHVQKRVNRRVMAQSASGQGGDAPFTINGQPADKAQLVRWLSLTFGATPAQTTPPPPPPTGLTNGHGPVQRRPHGRTRS